MPVTVGRFLDSCADLLRLRLTSGAGGLTREITDDRVRKTGLGMTDESDSLHRGTIRFLGETEVSWFRSQTPDRQSRIADLFFSRPMPCAIAGASLSLPLPLVETSERRGVPLLVSDLSPSDLTDGVHRALERMFRETVTVHGVLMEILGVGVALLGKSGIGKSECALDLILRGHRFVSDDVIHMEKRGPETLLGTGDDMTRYHMEIRGLGIINVRDLFGPTAVANRKKVEMVVQIEEWDAGKEYDRLGLGNRRMDILGVSLPTCLIPVSPGRNLATIVEVAVRNHLLKRRGVFSAADLVERQGKAVRGSDPK